MLYLKKLSLSKQKYAIQTFYKKDLWTKLQNKNFKFISTKYVETSNIECFYAHKLFKYYKEIWCTLKKTSTKVLQSILYLFYIFL